MGSCGSAVARHSLSESSFVSTRLSSPPLEEENVEVRHLGTRSSLSPPICSIALWTPSPLLQFDRVKRALVEESAASTHAWKNFTYRALGLGGFLGWGRIWRH